jgi:hypothetical protein
MNEVGAKIKSFVVENFLFGEDGNLEEDTSFLEEEFSITVDDEDLVPENLDSIKNVVTYLEKKLG